MRRHIFAVIIQAGTLIGCATAPPLATPGPGHPASLAEAEAPGPAPTGTLTPESVPAILDHSPRKTAESRPASIPESRPRGGHEGHGHGGER
jgi:hypothetical protein